MKFYIHYCLEPAFIFCLLVLRGLTMWVNLDMVTSFSVYMVALPSYHGSVKGFVFLFLYSYMLRLVDMVVEATESSGSADCR